MEVTILKSEEIIIIVSFINILNKTNFVASGDEVKKNNIF